MENNVNINWSELVGTRKLSCWDQMDFTRNIRDYEYTNRAAMNFGRITSSEEFEDMDSDVIFQYLSEDMQLIVFGDYLKRYICERAGEMDDAQLRSYIRETFKANRAPFSLSDNKTAIKPSVVNSWFTNDTVKRSVIFALGFGLKMKASDVSIFLTKVNKEEDFDFSKPDELVYWYCYNNDKPYAYALKILGEYKNYPKKKLKSYDWMELVNDSKYAKDSEKILQYYLAYLSDHESQRNEIIRGEYDKLYRRVQEAIAEMYKNDYLNPNSDITADDITSGDIERIMCCGTPLNEKGALEKVSKSVLSRQFQRRRLSRTRLDRIAAKKHMPERFDLISLLFFVYAIQDDYKVEVMEIDRKKRFLTYIEEINQILTKCSMLEIYPVNPYETFVLMCLLTDMPLISYTEIWEMSYDEEIK